MPKILAFLQNQITNLKNLGSISFWTWLAIKQHDQRFERIEKALNGHIHDSNQATKESIETLKKIEISNQAILEKLQNH